MILRMLGYQAIIPALLGLAGLMSCSGSGSAAASADEAVQIIPIEETMSASPPAPALQQSRFAYAGELTQGGFIRGQAPDGTVAASLGDQPLEIAPDGSFFAAFDRDSPAELALTARFENGQSLRETLTLSPRDWQIERVNVALRGGGSSEAWWAKREPEWLAIKAAREKVTGAQGWSQDFIWPVKGRISGRFGRQRIYRGEPGSYHSGIDIAPGDGVPFVAPADGVVVLARTGFSLEGGLIIIDHGAGLNSAFLHSSRIVVEEGESVKQGQHIGNVGSTGRATGPHLHWGLKWNAARLDPLLFAGPMN